MSGLRLSPSFALPLDIAGEAIAILAKRGAGKTNTGAVFVEELFASGIQVVRSDVARMVGAFQQIVKRGRGRGLGSIAITQRSAAFNKDILEQTDILVIHRTTGPNDRDAIERWVKVKADGAHAEVLESLPSLKDGEAWFWNPERDLCCRVQVRRRRTFDSGATPKPGQERQTPKAVAPIDLAKLGAEIEATVEKDKANDPGKLRQRVAELERQLASAPAAEDSGRVASLEEDLARATAVAEDLDGRLAEALGHEAHRKLLCRLLDDLHALHERGTADLLAVRVSGPSERVERGEPTQRRPLTVARPAPSEPRPPAHSTPSAPDDGSRVSRPQQALLDTLAWFETVGVPTPSRTALGFLAKTSPKSSGFEKNLSTLRTAGLLEYPFGGLVALTPAGRGRAVEPSIEPTDEALQDAIYLAIGNTKAQLLRVLVDRYPQAPSREELAELAGASASSSGFEKNLSTLRTLGLIDYPERGYVAALPVLFPVSERGGA